jgi:hypothetical protein
MSTDPERLIRHTVIGRREDSRHHPRRLATENQLVAQFLDLARRAGM